MENAIDAIQLQSVEMKILRENIIWHWLHRPIFIDEETNKRYDENETKRNKMKRRKDEKIPTTTTATATASAFSEQPKKKNQIYVYSFIRSNHFKCVYVFPYCMNDDVSKWRYF